MSLVAQRDFSAGMFRGVDPSLIPANGAYDIVGLLDEDGAVSGRGGSAVRSTSDASGAIIGMWDGYIGAARFVLFWTAGGDVYTLNSDSSITLKGNVSISSPDYMTPPVSLAGAVYFGAGSGGTGAKYDGATFATWALPSGISSGSPWHVAVAGNRLWVAQGDTLRFSDRDTPGTFGATSEHKLPGVKVLRIVGFRDSLIALTTRGVWRLSNVAVNLTDVDGNVQHRIDQMSQDVVPWGGLGVVTWAGGLIVPAVDAVWELPLGVQGEPLSPFAPVSDSIAPYYRSFVIGPGQAAVHRGHLLMPMDLGAGTAETLVCRLDRKGRPWTRMGGVPMGVLMTRPPASRSEVVELVGAFSSAALAKRVQQVRYFEPELTETENGAAVPFTLWVRDYATGAGEKNTVTKVRLVYELYGASSSPTVAALGGPGEDWALTALSGNAPETPGATGVVFARSTFAWLLHERCRSVRFRFSAVGQFTRVKVRAVEVFSRDSDRR